MQSVVKKIFLGAIATIIILFIVVYGATPYAVRHFAKDPLKDLGVTLDEDSYVTYNLITSTLTIENFTILSESQAQSFKIEEMAVSLYLHQLLFSKLYVSSFELRGGHLLLEKSGSTLVVAGIDLAQFAKPTDSQEPEPTESSDQGSEYTLVVKDFVIEDFSVNTQVEGHNNQFTIDKLAIDDVEANSLNQAIKLALTSSIDDSHFSLDLEAALSSMKGKALLDLQLDKLQLSNYQHFASDDLIQMVGELSVEVQTTAEIDNQNISLASPVTKFELANVDISYLPWQYSASNHTIDIVDTALTVNTDTQSYTVSNNIDIVFEQGNVSLSNKDNVLLSWGEVALSPKLNATSESPAVSVEQIKISNIDISKVLQSESSTAIGNISGIDINQVQYVGQRVDIDAILLSGGALNLHILADKSITNMVDLSSLSKQEESLDTENDDEQPTSSHGDSSDETQSETAFTFGLNKLSLTSPFEIKVQDESVSPIFNHHVTVSEIEVGKVDSSDAALATPLSVKMHDSAYFSLDLAGEVKPFGDKLNGAIKGKVNELTLNEISPYVSDALGFEMKSGQLDVDLDVTIAEDELDGDIDLAMRGLEMTKSDDFEKSTVKDGQAMPLNAALGMLKDDQGNIDLNVPMSGNISDPSFGMSSFMGLVLKKAAMSQAKSYLINTFVPYANVVTVVMSGAEYLLKLRLEPLIYEPAQVEISDSQLAYINQFAQLLIDKPEVQVKTCAMVHPTDIGVSHDVELTKEQMSALIEIGEQRQQELKAFLVKERSVPSSRVLTCAPEIDASETEQTRIELKTD